MIYHHWTSYLQVSDQTFCHQTHLQLIQNMGYSDGIGRGPENKGFTISTLFSAWTTSLTWSILPSNLPPISLQQYSDGIGRGPENKGLPGFSLTLCLDNLFDLTYNLLLLNPLLPKILIFGSFSLFFFCYSLFLFLIPYPSLIWFPFFSLPVSLLYIPPALFPLYYPALSPYVIPLHYLPVLFPLTQ